ncbi:unnamed protein product, partial [Musa textilis]
LEEPHSSHAHEEGVAGGCCHSLRLQKITQKIGKSHKSFGNVLVFNLGRQELKLKLHIECLKDTAAA